MEVRLAGFNTDVENRSSTPETLSAAYARISRDPRPIGLLRREAAAEVERARESNRRIVFGYGHGSVAEHAFFNLDLLDLSRLAAEAVQSFRLASFTEKSQRYIRLDRDWVVPEEVPSALRDEWTAALEDLFGLYGRACRALEEAGLPDGRAREDARYLLPLATSCQMGMSLNARELEHMIRRLSAHPLAEVRRLSSLLLDSAKGVAPSLLRHLEPVEMDRLAWEHPEPGHLEPSDDVTLIRGDDDCVVGARLLQRERGGGLADAGRSWSGLESVHRRRLFENVLESLGPYDALPREWELACFTFEVVASASAYAQLKRHRMSTQLVSSYSPALGLRVPPSYLDHGLEGLLEEAEAVSSAWRRRLEGRAAQYMMTNAHRRTVVVRMNAREMYHFARLRLDSHAQWDIRELAGKMVDLATSAAPLTMAAADARGSERPSPR